MIVIISEFRDQTQQGYEFKVSLGYPVVSPCATRLSPPKGKKETQYGEVFLF